MQLNKLFFLLILCSSIHFSSVDAQTFGTENLVRCESIEMDIELDREYRASFFGPGFNESNLKSTIQSKFQAAGIKLRNDNRAPGLLITSTTNGRSGDIVVFGIDFSIFDIITDDKGNEVYVAIYSDTYVGGTYEMSSENEAREMRNGTLYLVDRFIKAWKETH